SRVSMLNSRHATHTGVLGNRTDFRDAHPDWVTLPQLFKNNGWASLRTGKIFHGGIDDMVSWTEGGDPRRTGGDGAQRPLDPDDIVFVQNRPKQPARSKSDNSDR